MCMNRPIRALVSGSGKMGATIISALAAADGIEPVGVLEKFATAPSYAMTSGAELPMSAEPSQIMDDTRPDVVIDFTNAAWTPAVVDAALPRGVRLVIGTSGLSPEFIEDLRRRCAEQRLGAVIVANFALGAILMMHMAKLAARYFDAVEIIELHHAEKVDAPSGTALTTARLMLEARDGRPFGRNVPQSQPVEGSRAAELGGITLHSVRLPGLVAHQEVIFGGPGQTLTLRHDTFGRESFMPGVVLAVREVMRREELVVGLDTLIGLT
jgi:4-hydroxy-tetrahydrodipicolinate reductase